MVRSRASTFHSIHAAGWRSYQLAWCRVPQIRRCWRTTCHCAQHVRLLACSSTSQPMLDSSSHLVPAEWLAIERQQVRGHDPGHHACPAEFGCCCLRSRRRGYHSTSLVSVEVPRRDHRQPHALWQSRRSCRQDVQLPHSCPATRA